MSNIYPHAVAELWRGNINWLGNTQRAVVIDSADYTYNAGHKWLSDIPAAARLSSAVIGGKVRSAGHIDAGNTTVPGWAGDVGEAVVVYQDSGSEGSSPLICHLDGMVISSNGNDVQLQWSNGADRIARLNGTYLNTLDALWAGLIDWLSDTFRLVVVDGADYTYSPNHTFLSDVPTAARLSTSGPLAGKTVSDGGSIDATATIVPGWTGDGGEELIVYQDTGNESTSRLVAHQSGFQMVSLGNSFQIFIQDVFKL